ncbi:MAG: hypothetical protein HOP29_20050 [Phycisphaerales bacterium]|nr:hypothetical protein [Phycisphaerales bacterium]
MRNLPTLLAALVVVMVVGFYMCTFQVRFTEVAIVETFGEPADEPDREPGLKFKWPWPIQTVVKFDTRIRVLEDRTEETYTADSKNIIVTTSTFWTVDDPYKFHRAFQRVEDGEKQLRDAIRSQKKAVIGRYDFANFVSTDTTERKLATMEHEMLTGIHVEGESAVQSLADTWRGNYGVAIKYFGITKLTLPTSVTQAIFESMRKTEENKAKNYEAEGQAKAKQIVSAAEEARERIMSVANRKATEIRNEGERIVSELYAKFEEHQELRIFLDKLRTVVDSLSGDTTFILDSNTPPVDLFKLDTTGQMAPANAEPAAPRMIDRVAEGS